MKNAIERGLGFLYRPTTEFTRALGAEPSTGETFVQLLLPWTAAESVAIALESSALNGLKNLLLGVAVVFIAAWALFVLARILNSPASFARALFIASATAPLGLVSALATLVFAKLSLLIWIIAGVYGLYVTWTGCAVMLPKGRSVAIRATAGMTVASIVATLVLVLLTGTTPGPGASDDGVSADTIAREHEQFREMMHDAHMRRYR